MKQHIIAISNQKGGVGKTTTAINLSTAFAVMGKKILLIDFDPQGNASTGLGITSDLRDLSSYDLLCTQIQAEELIICTEVPGLDVICATMDLIAAEKELLNTLGKELILKQKLAKLKTRYDLVLIDCSPSLGLLTINALGAANSVLIPLQAEFFALEGLAHLLNTVVLIKDSINSHLVIEGIVITMSDKRNGLSQQVERDLRDKFGNLVYESVIPRNVKLSEAPSHGKPAIIYDTKCSGSIAYLMLAQEMLNNFNHE